MPSSSSAVASSASVPQLAISSAATTSSAEEGGQFCIAAYGEEEDREGGHDDLRCGPPPSGYDTSDQLPATHGDKVSEGAPGWLVSQSLVRAEVSTNYVERQFENSGQAPN